MSEDEGFWPLRARNKMNKHKSLRKTLPSMLCGFCVHFKGLPHQIKSQFDTFIQNVYIVPSILTLQSCKDREMLATDKQCTI